MKTRKSVLRSLAFGLMLTVLVIGSAVTAQAAKTNSKTIKAGQIYYVMDSDISGHAISQNQFAVTPKTSSTRYDLIYAYESNDGGQSKLQVRMAVGLSSSFKSTAGRAYIKSSPASNTGALLGIRVRSGTVVVQIATQNAANTFTLSLTNRPSNMTPIRARTVAKGKKINFKMAQGNAAYIPLIFGGTSGTKIKRTLSSTKYELYVFKSSYLERKIYQNGSKISTVQIKYNTKYSLSGKSYLCTLIQIRPSATSKSTGWMKNTKGNACFLYPRDFLGVSYTMQ